MKRWGSGGVEKKEKRHTWEKEIRPTGFHCQVAHSVFLPEIHARTTAVSYPVTRYGSGGGRGGTVAEIGLVKWGSSPQKFCGAVTRRTTAMRSGS